MQIHGNGTNKIGSDVSIRHHATTRTMRDTHINLFRRALQYTLVDAQVPIVHPSWLHHSKLQHMPVQHASYAKKLWPTLVGCIAQCTTTMGTKPTELTSISTTKKNPSQSTPSTKGVWCAWTHMAKPPRKLVGVNHAVLMHLYGINCGYASYKCCTWHKAPSAKRPEVASKSGSNAIAIFTRG